MPIRIVQSKQNARLKELRRALSRPGRGENGSAAGGLAGIEGPNLLEEALRSGLKLSCVFVAQQSQRLLDSLPLPADTEILLLPQELLFPALTTEAPQPVAALVQPPAWTAADVLSSPTQAAPLAVVLVGLQDPGNLGTIIRSAEAFGATGIFSLPGTVNEWNTKAVRASAGSVFRVPLVAVTAAECFAYLFKAGIKIWTTALYDAELPIMTDLDEIDLAQPSAFLIGNEGRGVPAELATQCDGALTIPHPGPVESLNASVAASVLLYEASRQRFTKAFATQMSRKTS